MTTATQLDDIKSRFDAHVRALQDQIDARMGRLDPELDCREDRWARTDHAGEPGGGGITRAFNGSVFETGGVNTSQIHGAIDPRFAAKLGGDSGDLWAAGISLILHPHSPRVPSVHANFRMIVHGTRWWFGGGADLTPFYPHADDFRHFHQTWATVCAAYGSYAAMKATCDAYFVNHHRQGEMRGVGGIFFDHHNTGDIEADFAMVRTLSEAFAESYFPLVERRHDEAFTEADAEFQGYRRGRYVEFNLLHDRGTKFGLETNGRTESILISLPARCRFGYRYEPTPRTPHAEMMRYYFPMDWVS